MERFSHGLDAALSSRLHCVAGRQWCSTAHCRDCARYLIEQRQASNRIPGGATFSLSHSGIEACGIPDGETLILTGGRTHSFVTRWVHEHRNSFSYGHEDANDDNPHTFEKQMWKTAQKRPRLIHFRLCPVPAKIAGTTSKALWGSFPNYRRRDMLMPVLLFPLG